MPLGFKFIATEAEKARGVWENTTGKTLYLNSTKTAIVTEDHPDVGFVLCGPGSKLSMEDAKLYGIIQDDAPEEVDTEITNKDVQESMKDETRKPQEPDTTLTDETRSTQGGESVADKEKAQKPASDKAVTGPSTK